MVVKWWLVRWWVGVDHWMGLLLALLTLSLQSTQTPMTKDSKFHLSRFGQVRVGNVSRLI